MMFRSDLLRQLRIRSACEHPESFGIAMRGDLLFRSSWRVFPKAVPLRIAYPECTNRTDRRICSKSAGTIWHP